MPGTEKGVSGRTPFSKATAFKRILGIDPGLASTGWAVVDYADSRYRCAGWGVIETVKDKKRGERPRRGSGRGSIILFGIALNFIFNSLTMFLQYIADENKLQSLVFWTFGSLAKASWDKALLLAIVVLAALAFLYRRAWQLTALVLDDARALSLGVNVPRLRRQVIILISLLTATTVSFVGTIGFLGLAAPHLARGLVGEDHRYLLPASALFGAFLLSVASLLSKLLIPGTLLPIGLITSILGIPFFMLLIFTAGRRYT